MEQSFYQINTRAWLHEISQDQGRTATLANVPDSVLDGLARRGFHWIWLLGIWQTGEIGRRISLANPPWQRSYEECLGSAWCEQDVCGSPFAIKEYTVAAELGGEEALRLLRARLHQRGLKLLLDFVPNHTALDHPWVKQRPEFYVHGSKLDLANQSANYTIVATDSGERILAHGRDPYFPAWSDTLQLNYRHPGLRHTMREQLLQVAGRCDGVRCDMAMLILPEIFQQTWGDRSRPQDGVAPDDAPFWPEAINRVRQRFPHFFFMAEVYWGLERVLLDQGFDSTYDKELYDELLGKDVEKIRRRLSADFEFQRKQVRFLENHDEVRAVQAFPWPMHQAAALITFLAPGWKFFHEGQLEGRQIKPVIHLKRRPAEAPNQEIHRFYDWLLSCLNRPELQHGQWQLLDCSPASGENLNGNQFIAFAWENAGDRILLAVVNYGAQKGHCVINLPWIIPSGRRMVIQDLGPSPRHTQTDPEIVSDRLSVELPPWGYQVYLLGVPQS